MTLPVLDTRSARRLFLHRHLLGALPSGSATGQGLADVISGLGFVQVDSVNTLSRAHDLILWSRRQAYRPASLRWLNDRARATFEHWTHDAAILPVAVFAHWRLRFARDGERLRHRWADWHGSAFHAEIDTVLRHVTDNGPVSSADMSGQRAEKSTGWWDWHPSKTALEYLWRTGALSITRRDGFRKVYDLTDRVIPPDALNARFSECETIDWACNAALDRLGFATSGELAAFWDLVRPAEAKDWVARNLQSGALREVCLICSDGRSRPSVMRPGDLATVRDLAPPPARLRMLSPFDPALRDRARAERLFGFHYRIEIFVPAPKRRYGYYVFPMLEGARMVGRVDMTADRQADTLRVRAVWPEQGVAWGKGRHARFEAELERLCRLACCARVTFERDWLRAPLANP